MNSIDLENELNEMADREVKRDPRPPWERGSAPEPVTFAPSSPSSSQWSSMSSSSQALVPMSGHDERNIATLTHVATLCAAVASAGFLDIVVPAVALAAFHDKSEFLKGHLKAQLNFQLTNLIVAAIGIVFSVITLGLGLIAVVPILFFYFLVDIVCSIRAAMAASRGEEYEFPFALELLK